MKYIKSKKFIWSVLSALVIVCFATIIYNKAMANTKTQYSFYITETPYIVKGADGQKEIYRLYSEQNFYNLYCLNAGAELNNNTTMDTSVNMYNITKEGKTSIFGKDLNRGTEEQRYAATLWIIDNIVVETKNDENGKIYKQYMIANLKNIIKAEYPYLTDSFMNQLESYITNDNNKDLFYSIQQAAIWHFTNNTDKVENFQEILQESSNSKTSVDNSYYKYIYGALVSQAKKAAQDGYKSPNQNGLQTYIKSLQLAKGANCKIDRNSKTVGPFTIKNYQKNATTFIDTPEFSVIVNGKVIESSQYQIINTNGKEYTFSIKFNDTYKLTDDELNIKVGIKNFTVVATEAKLLYEKSEIEASAKSTGRISQIQPVVSILKSIQHRTLEIELDAGEVPPPPVEENPEFDLALTKQITKITYTGKGNPTIQNISGRSKTPDTSRLLTQTTAYYEMNKPVLEVQTGAIVTYKISVYNEGEVSGYAKEITDYLPEGMEYIENSNLNKTYGWIALKNEDGTTTVKTTALSEKEIKEYNGGEILDSLYVEIECLVTSKEQSKVLLNVAEISKYGYYNGEEFIEATIEQKAIEKGDIDSVQNSVFSIISKTETSNLIEKYNENILKQTNINKMDKTEYDVEDDDDFEHIKIIKKDFDLALRKFITGVNKEKITGREPIFVIDIDGSYIYRHTKEPLPVDTGDIVTYTLRVYNEGNMAGFAEQIKDDIPEGLEFAQYTPGDGSINDIYGWKKEGNSIVSEYLSKVSGEKRDPNSKTNINLLQAFDPENMVEPDYKEVKVQFKVVYVVTKIEEANKVIINYAQISEDADEYGRDVEDIDSKPNVWVEGEDDQDIEKIKVRYFDLSLLKWVTKAIVIENGTETITPTGHTGLENPEPIVKVDLNKSKIDEVTVKFEYQIKITNEGEIAGYAKEISDYIPEGLRFDETEETNIKFGWKQMDGKVITEHLKDTLLNPGESAEVTIVLTWINGNNNLGKKVNTAEISKHYNEPEVPDIDSTPDNLVPEEDDIDTAPVMLIIKTGSNFNTTYFILGLAVILIITTGVILIKKYV